MIPLTRRSVLASAGVLLARRAQDVTVFDVAVYGATMSGICAAAAAAREGLNVALVAGPAAFAGISANGMSHADLQSPGYAGGLALSFYTAIGAAYGAGAPVFNYEPHVAFNVAAAMLGQYGVQLVSNELGHVDQTPVHTTLVFADGTTLYARYLVDASCEGDLLAAMGVPFCVGRESATTYGEALAGFGAGMQSWPVDGYDAGGNLLPGIIASPATAQGGADNGVQAYCYRLCLSSDRANQIPFFMPPGYDAANYAMAIPAGSAFHPGAALPNSKFDLDSVPTLFGIDFTGGSYKYPCSAGAQRRAIVGQHFGYQAGLLYFLANDPSVPAAYRASVQQYGLAADEFVGNDGWPLQLYIREARRLKGVTTLIQADVQTRSTKPDSIGVGFYATDCHPVWRYAMGTQAVCAEGNFNGLPNRPIAPYEIPYGALVPASGPTTLLVSVCASASHVAWCSLRVEHQQMIMGEAAGVAAAMAAQEKSPVAQVDIPTLQSKLAGYGARLHA